MARLKCDLAEKKPWSKVVPGQPVTVKVHWPKESSLLYLHEGQIVEQGTHQELLDRGIPGVTQDELFFAQSQID